MSNPETPKTASDLVVSASACVVERLAAAFAEHRFRQPEYVCTCGVLCGIECDNLTYAEHLASVVAALPNIAIVELPEMEPDETLSEFHGRLEMAWAGVRFRRYSAAIDARAAGGQA